MSEGDPVHQIVVLQAGAARRGALAMWTVYERPADYICGFVARMFLVEAGGPRPTMSTMKCLELGPIREKLMHAGLTCVGREAGDEPQVVETWL